MKKELIIRTGEIGVINKEDFHGIESIYISLMDTKDSIIAHYELNMDCFNEKEHIEYAANDYQVKFNGIIPKLIVETAPPKNNSDSTIH